MILSLSHKGLSAKAALCTLPIIISGCATREVLTDEEHAKKNPLQWIESRMDWQNGYAESGNSPKDWIQPYQPVSDIIASRGVATAEELAAFLLRHNTDLDPVWTRELATAYVQEGSIEGINSDAAFVQMCLETGYLRYRNSIITPEQNNFCGLGSVNTRTPGHSFSTKEEGVRAHIQHLKAYGTTEPLVRQCIDPRFELVNRGSAPTVMDLTNRWAMDSAYGEKLESLLTHLDDHVFRTRDAALAMTAN